MTEEKTAEAARIRRRWINLGEVLAVAAVGISGLTLWNSWSEREATRVEKTTADTRAATAARTLLLKATPDRDARRLALAPLLDAQTIQDQTIRFPAALGLTPVATTGDARIEAGWFDDALVRARKAAGLPGDTRGDERLPVLIATRFLTDGHVATDTAIYDLGYATDSGFLTGTAVRLRGLSLVSRGGTQARIDRTWAARARTR